MHEPNELVSRQLPLNAGERRAPPDRFFSGLIIATLLLVACFAVPLYHWARFALDSDLYSYVLLVPLVTAYLFYTKVKKPFGPAGPRNAVLAGLFVGLGAAAAAWFLWARYSGARWEWQDLLALGTLSFVLLFAGICAFFLGPQELRKAAFPLVFLLFMVPFPLAFEQALEGFLQHGSAPPAHWLFKLAGTPVFKRDMLFQLPGITLQIAPECSGIRSTIVLFMTSLLAGDLFLRSPWRRTVLAAFVLPLALARNGLRIFTIGELCVHIGPHMIDSNIHHKGGPIFFALSLIPFFLLVFFLIKTDRAADSAKPPSIASQHA